MKQLPVTILFKVEDGKLVPKRDMDKFKLENYIKGLEEGQTIQITYEEYATDGTYAQISKLQACTREIANYLGYSHDEVKDMIKVRAGLYDAEANIKSFGDCSKEELSLAIQTVLDFGEQVGFPLQ